MGVDRSATQQLLQWKELGKELAGAEKEEEAQEESLSFKLEGPFYCLEAGSTKVEKRFACLRDDLLLMGPKWNVVDECVNLSGKRCFRSGRMISFSSGRGDVFLRLVVGCEAEAEQWQISATAAADSPRSSEQFLARLQAAIQKQKKAETWRWRAAKVGSVVEWLCGERPMDRHRAAEAAEMMPPASPDASPGGFFKGRCSRKGDGGAWEGMGCLMFISELLIVFPEAKEADARGLLLGGTSPTVSGSMVTVRSGPQEILRVWLADDEEAERLGQEVRKAAGEVAMDRPQAPSGRPSTTRRQLASAASCVCSTAAKAPGALVRSLLGCQRGALRRDYLKANSPVLDQACRILRSGAKAVRSCHITLRGDALWLGERCNQGDEVISLCNTNTVVAGKMLVIELEGKVLARLWFEGDETTLSSWAIALQAAGKLVPRGESEARLRKENLEAEVRRLQRQRQGRKLAYWLQGAVLPRRRSATELLMQWQENSRLAMATEESDSLKPVEEVTSMGSVRVMCRDFMSRAETRTVDLLGDVLCTRHEDGREEPPVSLQGCTVYSSSKVLSVWFDGELRVRFFFDSEELAESWTAPLQSAAELLSKAKSKPMLRVASPQKPKVLAPECSLEGAAAAVSPSKAKSSSGLHRARRYGGSTANLQDDQKLPASVMGG